MDILLKRLLLGVFHLGFRHRRRVVVENIPLAADLLVDKGVARLNDEPCRPFGQGEGVDPASMPRCCPVADIAVVDLADGLSQEVIKVVLSGPVWWYLVDTVGCNTAPRIQIHHRLHGNGLQRAVPTVKKPAISRSFTLAGAWATSAVHIRGVSAA